MSRLLIVTLFSLLYQFTNAQLNKNPGFETGDLSNWWFETPATYGNAEPGYTCSVVKGLSPGKNFALQFASTNNSYWCQLKQGITYKPADSSERLRISASVKLEGVSNCSAGIALRTYGQAKDFGITSKNLDKDTGWAKLSFEVVINKQTDSLLLFCLMTGSGKAFFDDVKIEKVASGTAKQSTPGKAHVATTDIAMVVENLKLSGGATRQFYQKLPNPYK